MLSNHRPNLTRRYNWRGSEKEKSSPKWPCYKALKFTHYLHFCGVELRYWLMNKLIWLVIFGKKCSPPRRDVGWGHFDGKKVWERPRVWDVVWKACCEHQGEGVRTRGQWGHGAPGETVNPKERRVPVRLGKHKVCYFNQHTHPLFFFLLTSLLEYNCFTMFC